MSFIHMASGTLRALYMGDNDLNSFPPSVEKFELLQVVNTVNTYLDWHVINVIVGA